MPQHLNKPWTERQHNNGHRFSVSDSQYVRGGITGWLTGLEAKWLEDQLRRAG
jgi:hypothetical protein